MRTQSRRLLLCAATLLVAAGCLSPTLPLPPPGDPEVTAPNVQGLVRIRGSAPRDSWVTAFNRTTQRGFIQAAPEGRYDLEFPAETGDPIALWYEIGGRSSEVLEFTVPEPAPQPIPEPEPAP